MLELEKQVNNNIMEKQTSNKTLVAGLSAGDKVRYKINYNGIKRYWDAMVVDTEPLTLRIKFPDDYVYYAEPDKTQWKFIRKTSK